MWFGAVFQCSVASGGLIMSSLLADIRSCGHFVVMCKMAQATMVCVCVLFQVHKAKLRSIAKNGARKVSRHRTKQCRKYQVKEGEGAWDICNHHGVSFDHLRKINTGKCEHGCCLTD